jgi:hypothetical protein
VWISVRFPENLLSLRPTGLWVCGLTGFHERTLCIDLVQCEEDDLCSEVTYTAMAHNEELGEITGGQENFYEVMSRLITSGI